MGCVKPNALDMDGNCEFDRFPFLTSKILFMNYFYYNILALQPICKLKFIYLSLHIISGGVCRV